MALHKSVSYVPADGVAHETEKIINRKTSMSVQTEDVVDTLQRIVNVRTASSQTGLLSSLFKLCLIWQNAALNKSIMPHILRLHAEAEYVHARRCCRFAEPVESTC